jgi:hypothetical protein
MFKFNILHICPSWSCRSQALRPKRSYTKNIVQPAAQGYCQEKGFTKAHPFHKFTGLF